MVSIDPNSASTSEGLSLDFTVYSYSDGSASGADGISFMILNADNVPPPSTLGCVGSGLGYGAIEHGYLGIGLDEYGNFSKTPVCTTGTPATADKNKIVIRGATTNNSQTTNPYIIGNNPNTPMWQQVTTRQEATALKYHIIFTNAGVVSVFLNGVPYLAGVNVVPFVGTPPGNLYFGFAASTGTHYNIHEIQDFSISIPTDTSLDMTVAADPSSFSVGGTNQNYILTIRNTGGSASSGNIQLFDNLPPGVTLSGPLSLSGPGSTGASINGCSAPGSTSLGNSCIISNASISSVPPDNYLTITVPVDVSAAATNGNNSASLYGGGDDGCNSLAYSPYLCSGTVMVTVN